MRRALAAVGVAVACVAGTVAFAGSAAAAPASTAAVAAYNNACGSGYQVIDSADIGTLGTVYLTWNTNTEENCVVTVRATPGTAVHMVAEIFLADDATVIAEDDGFYTTYAGPVYLPAPGKCVFWGGLIDSSSVLDQGHCGSLA